MNRRPSFAVVAAGSLLLAAVAGLGVAALWPSQATSAPKAAAATAAGAATTPSEPSTPTATTQAAAITLQADKSHAAAGERINLTGNAGGSGIALVVQERQDGSWVDFPAHGTTRSDGSFASYVLFGRVGEHELRMRAPATGQVSSSVTVTVG